MRFVLSILSAMVLLVVGGTVAYANPPVTCPGGGGPVGGVCVIVADGPGESGSGGGNSGGGDTGGGVGGGGGDSSGSGQGSDEDPGECMLGAMEVGCVSPQGVYTGDCYIRAADPQPPKSDPVWEGHTDGVIIECLSVPCMLVGAAGDDRDCGSIYWAGSSPVPPPPSPRELADRAVSLMRLNAGQIGIAPPADRGVVGVPVWLWVADAGASTTGPITKTSSAGGTTVTATARLDRIVYNTGDGHSVTCSGGGTPFTGGSTVSPDCGYTYKQSSVGRPGNAYTVTATSYWTVEWNGGGQSGEIPLEFSRDIQVHVGEFQTLVTD